MPPYFAEGNPGRLSDKKRDGIIPSLESHSCEAFETFPKLWTLLASCWKQDPAGIPSTESLIASLDTILTQADEQEKRGQAERRDSS